MPLSLQQCRDGIHALHAYRLVALDQSMFFTKEGAAQLGAGVCRAICLDWIRRKLFANKASFAQSKKPDGAGRLEDRLARKGPRLAEAHKTISAVDTSSIAIVNHLTGLGHKWAVLSQVSVAELGPGPKSLHIPNELKTDEDCEKGKVMFGQIVDRCLQPPQNQRDAAYVVTAEIRRLIADGKDQEAERKATKLTGGYESACFLVDLTGYRMRKVLRSMRTEDRAAVQQKSYGEYLQGFKRVGHSVALEVSKKDGTFQYIDPNLGEYRFPVGDREKLLDLFNFVWNYVALQDHLVFDKFEISYFNK